MAELATSRRLVMSPTAHVTEPMMKGFMRSLILGMRSDPARDSWEQADDFREQVEIPLTRFRTWVEGIAPVFTSTHGLTDTQLGKIDTRKANERVTVIHKASQIEMTGKNTDEAKSKIRDFLGDLLARWLEDGDLTAQVRMYTQSLTSEMRAQYMTG